MLKNCNGVILHRFKYSERSLIAKIFTDHFGLQSFLLKGVRNKKSKVKASLLQPMALVDLVADIKEERGLQHIREMKAGFQPDTSFNAARNAVMFFLAEVVLKSIRETGPDRDLFTFITGAIREYQAHPSPDFHLLFLIELSKHLGFYPLYNENQPFSYFDLREGKFVPARPVHGDYLEEKDASLLRLFLGTKFASLNAFSLTNTQREGALRILLEYYRIHIPAMGEIRSVDVLRALFS